jgi:hypothetical protein
MMWLPRARDNGLIVEQMGGELLIYDEDRHRAYRLNAASALIWAHCDGTHSVEALTALIRRELDIAGADQVAVLALRQLQRARLLANTPDVSEPVTSLTRRELARSLALSGALAFLLPAIESVACGGPGAIGSCVRDCRRNVTECCPCFNSAQQAQNQCRTRRCRRNSCVPIATSGCTPPADDDDDDDDDNDDDDDD